MSTTLQQPALSGPKATGKDITDVEPVDINTDTRSPIRLGFWVLVVGFGLFLLWAAFAPLDEGVSAPATVSVEARRKTIQHLQGGVIKEVAVKEGQEVKQGDVLVVLDDSTVRATYEAIRQNYLSQRALESRLMAEATDSRTIAFHADLKPEDPVAAQLMAVQQQVMASRKAAQAAEIAAVEESIAGYQSQIAGLKLMLQNRGTQAALQARQVENVKRLAEDGYAPRNQALALEQQQAELRASLAELETNIVRAGNAIAELRQRIAQRKQESLKEVSSLLADVRREVQANQERLVAISADLSRMVIKSPVDGQVVALALAQRGGGVVTPGQRLMDISPKGESLLLDARVPPQVIDRVKAGDKTEVRFSAFANSPTLVVHGRVASLSHDAVSEQVGPNVMSYYLARVEITPEGMKALGNRTMQPGMPAEVLVRTGERSLLTYLLHPLTKRVAAAMTEE